MDLQVQDIRFAYKKGVKNVLDGISFHAKEGNITTIIGSNGAGKSTLIKSILGLLKAEGSILIGGKNRNDYTRTQITQCIGYLTQENASLSVLSVFEVVMLGRMNSLGFRVRSSEVDQVWDILKMLRIDHLAKNRFCELSGGQRRIIGIAQTLVRNPEILILDEPTANLDIQNQLEVLELVRDCTKKQGLTTVAILHDLNMACRYSDEMVLLKNGTVYGTGMPSQVITEESVRNVYGVVAHLDLDRCGILMIHPIQSVRSLSGQAETEAVS